VEFYWIERGEEEFVVLRRPGQVSNGRREDCRKKKELAEKLQV